MSEPKKPVGGEEPSELPQQAQADGWDGPLSWPVWLLAAAAWVAILVWAKLSWS